MVSIFFKIVVGEIFCYKIVEFEDYLVFFDINFIVKGYILVIFKMEIDYIFDLEDDVIGGFMVFVKKVVKVFDQVIFFKCVGVMVVGIEVFYVYVYLLFF